MFLENSWNLVLQDEWKKPYFKEIIQFLTERRDQGVEIYPSENQMFKVFQLTPFDQVKVVIIGQDPYHQPGQAEGLAFSVPRGTRLPPSLRNIYKELANDLEISPAPHGHLEKWARQGVFLLNAILTVEKGKPLAHAKIGWETFTDRVIASLLEREEPTIFVLYGQVSKNKVFKIKNESHGRHLFLVSPHPSPLSAYQGFFGCRHFSKINEELTKRGDAPIDWHLE